MVAKLCKTELTDPAVLHRFNDKFYVGDDGCWIWTSTLSHGYPLFVCSHLTPHQVMAGRYSYEAFVHPLGKETQRVRRTCDVKLCVNPDHLWAGLWPPPTVAKFWPKVRKTETCWMWTGAPNSDGYGHIGDRGRTVAAHRWVYETEVGPIPEGLEIDHLCRVRLCVNPAHLEAVPKKVNCLRGESPTAINARKTHCPHGHPYDEENTLWTTDGHRQCITCRKEYQRKYRDANREKINEAARRGYHRRKNR